MVKRALTCALASLAFGFGAAAAEGPSAKLHALFDEYWEQQLRESPTFATFVGDTRYNDRLDDLSAPAVKRRRAAQLDFLHRLESIGEGGLGDPDRVSRSVLLSKLRAQIRCNRLLGELPLEIGVLGDVAPISQMDGPQFWLPIVVKATRFAAVRDYEDYLKRLAAMPRFAQQLTANMQAGIDSGWIPPRITLRNVPDQLTPLADPAPAQNPLFDPFKSFPPDLPPAEQSRLRLAGESAIRDTVAPAFSGVQAFFRDRYLPAAREDIAASKLPGGQDFYAAVLQLNNTTALSAAEIHDIGLREVARIETEMAATQKRAGFAGSREEFLKYLWSDPKFFATTPAEMLTIYRDIAKRIDPQLPTLFHELPRQTYGVRAMPKEAGDNSEQYIEGAEDGSRAGWFEANTNSMNHRARWQMADLVLHEAVPGHHLQGARAQELRDLPKFRREIFFPAYIEGWALYAETLGDMIGMYDDPYDKYGQLGGELLRAARLVVDTGMHAKGWSRDRAIQYMKDHTTESADDIVAEVDRYIVWPGQATAYKIGQLRILALRDRARAALGERFDLRAYHNAVIDGGSMPLDVLEQEIDRWIAAQKAAK